MTPLPETIARIRQQYADGVPLAQISVDNKVNKSTVYRWVDGGGSRDPARRLPPVPRRRRPASKDVTAVDVTQDDCKDGISHAARGLLVKRLWRAAEAQVGDIEQRLAAAGQEPPERERDARLLAVLVKTLRELAAFDQAHSAAQSRTEPADDDAGPRDMDEFRRELARKIDAIIAERDA
jgi:hypothetical protein